MSSQVEALIGSDRGLLKDLVKEALHDQSMTNLGRLEYLDIGNNAGLCAPGDAAFQAWLATVRDFTGDTCADDVPAAPLLAQLLLALLLLGGGADYRVRQARHWAR